MPRAGYGPPFRRDSDLPFGWSGGCPASRLNRGGCGGGATCTHRIFDNPLCPLRDAGSSRTVRQRITCDTLDVRRDNPSTHDPGLYSCRSRGGGAEHYWPRGLRAPLQPAQGSEGLGYPPPGRPSRLRGSPGQEQQVGQLLNDAHFFGDIPADQPIVTLTLTLNWKADAGIGGLRGRGQLPAGSAGASQGGLRA